MWFGIQKLQVIFFTGKMEADRALEYLELNGASYRKRAKTGAHSPIESFSKSLITVDSDNGSETLLQCFVCIILTLPSKLF